MWAMMGTEAMKVLFDLRWMLVLMFVFICADFWWGWSESRMRYEDAKTENDKVMMDRYKFHLSRAVRRSANKIVDYLTYLLVGTVLGLAVFENLGITTHTVTAAIGLLVGCLCDAWSMFGHICYVKRVDKSSIKGFAKNMAVAFVRRKDNDVGDALEETLDKEENNLKKDKENGKRTKK